MFVNYARARYNPRQNEGIGLWLKSHLLDAIVLSQRFEMRSLRSERGA
jgi:hypothetical protein